jgi:hypothetical protein
MAEMGDRDQGDAGFGAGCGLATARADACFIGWASGYGDGTEG